LNEGAETATQILAADEFAEDWKC